MGSTTPEGTPFSAIVPEDAGVVIRTGAMVVETDDGTRYSGEIDHAEAVADPLGTVVKISGMLELTGWESRRRC